MAELGAEQSALGSLFYEGISEWEAGLAAAFTVRGQSPCGWSNSTTTEARINACAETLRALPTALKHAICYQLMNPDIR